MSTPVEWRRLWEEKSAKDVPDYEFDRGTCERDPEIEYLSRQELLSFIDPKSEDIVFDAGCGTGANIFMLCRRVRKVIGMDCTAGALARCQKRVDSEGIPNVELMQGDVTRLPSPSGSVDKILCMSVFQYVKDEEVRTALQEFSRVLKSDGTLILHLKNISSLYLSTLWLAKRLKMLVGGNTKLEYFRSYKWYETELRIVGFEVQACNSFNLIMLEGMPRWLLSFLQRLELKRYNQFPFRTKFLRRHGSDLKIKARVLKSPAA